MAANKYDYEVTDLDALEEFAPNAIEVIKRPVRGMISKMLDAGVKIPGIKVIEGTPPEPEHPELHGRTGPASGTK